ncbi:B12-binding domain-containing radical SAM protein [Niabella insulamsoli]|uniref:B12-binding domain-containing radical SAM protein n=1 Tax=Niabella insulamsoli TaxID=3144874 RepID=UPI0031FBCB7B
MKHYKVVLISMSGVRVYNTSLLELGLTLPGFVERSKVIASLPSLGLLTLAAHTPPHWEVAYRELDNFTEDDLQEIENEQPNIVAFSALTAGINETYTIAARFRACGITVAIGGLHVSALPDEAIRFADAVIQGEGEAIWPTLLSDYEKGILNPMYSSITNLDFNFHLHEAKVPRYDLLDISKYNRLTIQTTRGCPLHCSFCASSRTISRYKKKPIRLIEKELNKIFEIWHRPFIELADDNTFIDKDWSKQLLDLFANYKMKWFTETDISVAYDDSLLEKLAESNCAQILVGFETTSKKGLKDLDNANWKFKQFDRYYSAIEKIQSYGISVNGCFILGFDTDTIDTFKETEDFIKNSHLSEVQITMLTPFPNTMLYHQLKRENRLLKENYWDQCTLFDATFHPKNFTVEEFEHNFQRLMTNIYANETVKRCNRHFKQLLKSKINRTL